MTTDLARRLADQRIASARADLARDAQRLAESAANYAKSVPTAALHGDEARRLAHRAADLLLDAARLDGMRLFDPLVPGDGEPS